MGKYVYIYTPSKLGLYIYTKESPLPISDTDFNTIDDFDGDSGLKILTY